MRIAVLATLAALVALPALAASDDVYIGVLGASDRRQRRIRKLLQDRGPASPEDHQ